MYAIPRNHPIEPRISAGFKDLKFRSLQVCKFCRFYKLKQDYRICLVRFFWLTSLLDGEGALGLNSCCYV
jgi:hypothetical protein